MGTWPTSINKMIGLDCLLRLANIPIIFFSTEVLKGKFCTIKTTYSFTVMLLTHLLSTFIAIYRWVFVCHPTWVLTANQRRSFHLLLSGILGSLAVLLSGGAYFYREFSLHRRNCINNREVTGGVVWSLPLWHPFHALAVICFFSYLLLAPLLYVLIYRSERWIVEPEKAKKHFDGAGKLPRLAFGNSLLGSAHPWFYQRLSGDLFDADLVLLPDPLLHQHREQHG